ncbi:MAG: hypothetical protein WD208_12700 [Dehalococcoidia bacterium]
MDVRTTLVLLTFNAIVVSAVACFPPNSHYKIPNDVTISVISAGEEPNGNEYLIVGTVEDGVRVTFNRGGDWTESIGLPEGSTVRDISAASGDVPLFAATNHGLFRSNDAGRSWSKVVDQSPQRFDFVSAREVVLSPEFDQNGMLGIVAADRTIGLSAFLSFDGGETWSNPVQFGTVDIQAIAGSIIATTSRERVHVHEFLPDRKPTEIIFAEPPVNRATISPQFSQDGLVFYRGTSGTTMRRFDSNSETGEMIDSGLQLGGAAHLCADDVDWSRFEEDPWCWHAAAVLSPTFAPDGVGFVISTEGLYRTNDQGVSWEPVGLPLNSGEEVHDVRFVQSNPERVLVATDQRIFVLDDLGERFRP